MYGSVEGLIEIAGTQVKSFHLQWDFNLPNTAQTQSLCRCVDKASGTDGSDPVLQADSKDDAMCSISTPSFVKAHRGDQLR